MISILFIVFGVLLVIGLPVAVSLGLGSAAAMLFTGQVPLLLIPQKVFSSLNSFTIMAIPLFLIAGNIMSESKISDKLVDLAYLLVGRHRGSLAHVATGASAFFGAISGSAPATTAAIGAIMIPSMDKRGYGKAFSAANVAASGVLGLIIPPSLTMVVYGVTAGVSIGSMFLNGFIPGLMITAALMAVNYIRAIKKKIPRDTVKYTREEKAKIIKDSLLALMMPVIILGGIYSGIFTATESAAIACLYGIIIGKFVYRTLSWKQLFLVFRKSIDNIAMIFLLMATASIFGYVIAREQLPQKLAALLLGFTTNQQVIMFIVMIGLLVLGTFMDNVGALVLIVPTLMAVVNQAGIDPIYFGMFTIITLAVGQITPPVGLNLFVATNISKAKFEDVVREIIPYILVYLAMLIVFIFFPSLLSFFKI